MVGPKTVWPRLDRAMPAAVRRVLAALQTASGRAVLVGGAVRDACLGQPVGDWDLATDLAPAVVAGLFERVNRAGERHGTIMVLDGGRAVEVTTFRGEGPYLDGRRPSTVYFHGQLEADLARRDFTINAMAVEPLTGALIDPFGGRRDLAARLVRCVGRAEDRFAEDGLRPLRALRFAAVLGFALAPATRAALPGAASTLARVAWERRRVELEKLLQGRGPLAPVTRILERTGLLEVVAPELCEGRAVPWTAIERLPPRPYLRLAAWFVARGLGESPARAVLERWRAAKRARQEVLAWVRGVRALPPKPPRAVERRAWITDIGADLAADAALVAATTCGAAYGRFARQVRDELRLGGPHAVAELEVDGDDLASLGLTGPAVGRTLRLLLGAVQARRVPNHRESLLAYAHRLSTGPNRPFS